jgi:release factor-specific protein-(glutamine-N5) methyltransferase
MVIREILALCEKKLAGVENARFESALTVRAVLGLDALGLVLGAKNEVSAEDEQKILAFAERRAANEPLEYILGTQEFMSLEFDVNPSVLIPRADTETLVERVIDICGESSAKVLDIGCGSGCIGISIAYYAVNTRVTEADISVGALETAERNAVKNGTAERMRFVRCDILSELPDTAEGLFDVVVSNPPYIESGVIETLDTNVRDFEPRSALDGGADGLVFYRRIVSAARSMLKVGGTLAFEIGFNQGGAVSGLMAADFDGVEVIKDLCGNDRVVVGMLRG